MIKSKIKVLTLAVTAASSAAQAGVLSHNDPSAFNPGQVAQFSTLTWGPTMFSSDVGTAVNPDYSGGTAAFVHTAGGNGQVQNTNVTCTNDGSTGAAPADDLQEGNIAGVPFGDYWQFNSPFGVYIQNTYSDCDINFGASGEVVDGWGENLAFGSGPGLVQPFYNFTAPRFQADFTGADCAAQSGPALQAHGAAAFALISGGGSFGTGTALSDAVVAGDAGLAIGDCALAFMGPIAMGQCDPALSSAPCATGSSKAVPVPAFAAAALGLGLVGVTVLTSRRRQVG